MLFQYGFREEYSYITRTLLVQEMCRDDMEGAAQTPYPNH